MAKKMKISSLLTALAAILGVVAIIMLFVPAIGWKNLDGTFKGMDVVFGCKGKGTEISTLNFSFMNLLTYILVLAGTVLSLLNVLVKKPSKLFSLIAAGDRVEDEKFDRFVNDRARISFYGDFLYPLAKDSTLEEYYLEAPEGSFCEELKDCRTDI